MNRTFRSPARRTAAVMALVALALAVSVMAGCSGQSSTAGAEGLIVRNFGAKDPCQRTLFDLAPKPGVDLVQSGTKLVNAYEGYQAIGEVVLDPAEGTLDVTWCNAMQSEQGVVRAANLSGLVAIESFATSPAN